MGYLLDTNIISLEFRNNLNIKSKIQLLQSQNEQIYISVMGNQRN